MRKTVPSRAKRFTYLLGLGLMKHSRWGNAMYVEAKKRNQRTGTIYRRISRCFLRIIHSMLKHGTQYDEELYIRNAEASDAPWAQKLVLLGGSNVPIIPASPDKPLASP